MRAPGLLAALAIASLISLPAAGQDETPQGDPPVARVGDIADPCVQPEELLVLEMVQRRTAELDQREAMIAVREQALVEYHEELEAEVARLETIRDELITLVESRSRAHAEGLDALIKMVNEMKPAPAAEVLAEVDRDLAATVLQRLSSRQAAKVMAAMDPDVAAELGEMLATDPIATGDPREETP